MALVEPGNGRRRYSSDFPNPRLDKTGEDFKKLQNQLQANRPTGGIVALPSVEMIQEIFGCVRCHNFPHPKNYLVCEENGHFLCGRCCWTGIDDSGSSEADADITPLEPCCSPEKLKKGYPHLLDHLINNSYWECSHKAKGCQEAIVGHKWEEHVKTCGFALSPLGCKFYHCSVKSRSIAVAVNHLVNDHNAIRFDDTPTKLCVPFEESRQTRMIALFKFNGRYLIFSCEFYLPKVYMWMWIMDSVYGKDKEDVKYCLELKSNNPKSRLEMRYKAKCVPYEKSTRELVAANECLDISFDQFVREYVTKDENPRTWSVQVSLKQCTDSPK